VRLVWRRSAGTLRINPFVESGGGGVGCGWLWVVGGLVVDHGGGEERRISKVKAKVPWAGLALI